MLSTDIRYGVQQCPVGFDPALVDCPLEMGEPVFEAAMLCIGRDHRHHSAAQLPCCREESPLDFESSLKVERASCRLPAREYAVMSAAESGSLISSVVLLRICACICCTWWRLWLFALLWLWGVRMRVYIFASASMPLPLM